MIKVSRGCLGEEEISAVCDVFNYGYFGMAHKVEEFEDALRNYLHAEEVIATNTGTSALHLALEALGIGEGDEVIVPSLTFVASFQSIAATGATPVACDIDPSTLLLDLADVERRISRKTRAIMPVHFAGNACDLDALGDLSLKYNLRVVEDAAHAFGSSYKGRRVGSFGDVVCFSFDSIKNLTCGEGGAVVCREKMLSETIRRKRVLGINRNFCAKDGAACPAGAFEVATLGFRYHMSDINAAIGLAQLKKVDRFISRRREICRKYDRALTGVPNIKPIRINYDEIAPHIYVVRVGDGARGTLQRYLRERDIETSISYVPNHLHPYFHVDGLSLPETERAYREILNLPLHCGLSDDDIELVSSRIVEFSRGMTASGGAR